jgi:hypothetical protein
MYVSVFWTHLAYVGRCVGSGHPKPRSSSILESAHFLPHHPSNSPLECNVRDGSNKHLFGNRRARRKAEAVVEPDAAHPRRPGCAVPIHAVVSDDRAGGGHGEAWARGEGRRRHGMQPLVPGERDPPGWAQNRAEVRDRAAAGGLASARATTGGGAATGTEAVAARTAAGTAPPAG